MGQAINYDDYYDDYNDKKNTQYIYIYIESPDRLLLYYC